jgi:Type I phosphodiesterase / nucleotide pyrophosphatase
VSRTARGVKRSVAAALCAALLAGAFVGAYLLLFNAVGGVSARLQIFMASTLGYAAILVVPLFVGVSAVAALATRVWPSGRLARRDAALLFEVALGLVVAVAIARYAFDPVKATLQGWDPAYSLHALARALGIAVFVLAAVHVAGRIITGFPAAAARRAAVALVVAAFAAAAGLLVVAEPGKMLRDTTAAAHDDAAGDLERAATVERTGPARRVAVLAFDGLDPRILAALIARGDMPNFAALQKQAVYSDFATLTLGLSPAIWTTIATGVRPAFHGIHDFFRRPVAGTSVDLSAIHHMPTGFATAALRSAIVRSSFVDERPVMPAQRRAPAFWTLASYVGVRSCIVDWMATWPAEPIDGLLVSDRAFFWWNEGKLARVTDDVAGSSLPLRFLDTKGEQGNEKDAFGLCKPAPDCMRFFGDRKNHEQVRVEEGVRFHLAENAFYRDLAARAFTAENCELMAFYDHLPDFVNHSLRPPELRNVRQGTISTKGEELARTMYRDADETLGLLLHAVGPDAAVVVMSDHGVEIIEEIDGDQVSHEKGPSGIFFFRPSAGRPPPSLNGTPTIYDVAPTVLALLGLPVPDYSDGHPLAPIVAAELGEDARARSVALDPGKFAVKSSTAGDARVEEESRERLRALGYVQ